MIISRTYQTTKYEEAVDVITTYRLSVDADEARRLGAELRERRITVGFNPWWYGYITWGEIERLETGDYDEETLLYSYRELKTYIRHLGLDESIVTRAFDEAVITAKIDVGTADVTIPLPHDAPEQVVKTEEAAHHPKPPKFGEYLLYCFLTKRERINLIGDLEEEYEEVYEKFGLRKAKVWYYKQVFDSLRPLMKRTIIRLGIQVVVIDFLRWLLKLLRGF